MSTTPTTKPTSDTAIPDASMRIRRPKARATLAIGTLASLVLGSVAVATVAQQTAHAAPPGPVPTSYAALSDAELWDVIHSDGDLAVVGLRDDAEPEGVRGGEILVDATERAEAEADVLSVPGVDLMSRNRVLPFVTVKLSNGKAITRLRASSHVEYVEPANFDAKPMAFGCDFEPPSSQPQPLPSGDLMPLHFRAARTQEAWGRSPAGAVGVMDTGLYGSPLDAVAARARAPPPR